MKTWIVMSVSPLREIARIEADSCEIGPSSGRVVLYNDEGECVGTFASKAVHVIAVDDYCQDMKDRSAGESVP